MKKLLLSVAFLIVPASGARADFILSTSNPPGTPLTMSAGTTSGSMLVTVSDTSPNDIVSGWQFQLEIMPEGGAAGTLTFQDPVPDPVTGAVPNPPNYFFGTDSLAGIYAVNGGSMLSANDFYYNPNDPSMTGLEAQGAPPNLLQMDFLASSDASGLFGIYAEEGQQNTIWTDSSMTTQFFTNVPDGTDVVLIGEVYVTPSAQTVPAPNALTLLGTGATILVIWGWWRKRKQTAALPDLDARPSRFGTASGLRVQA